MIIYHFTCKLCWYTWLDYDISSLCPGCGAQDYFANKDHSSTETRLDLCEKEIEKLLRRKKMRKKCATCENEYSVHEGGCPYCYMRNQGQQEKDSIKALNDKLDKILEHLMGKAPPCREIKIRAEIIATDDIHKNRTVDDAVNEARADLINDGWIVKSIEPVKEGS